MRGGSKFCVCMREMAAQKHLWHPGNACHCLLLKSCSVILWYFGKKIKLWTRLYWHWNGYPDWISQKWQYINGSYINTRHDPGKIVRFVSVTGLKTQDILTVVSSYNLTILCWWMNLPKVITANVKTATDAKAFLFLSITVNAKFLKIFYDLCLMLSKCNFAIVALRGFLYSRYIYILLTSLQVK